MVQTLSDKTIQALYRLFMAGEVSVKEIETLQGSYQAGLWGYSSDRTRAVATTRLVEIWRGLPYVEEAIAAILSYEPNLRQAWQRIICDRLLEMGQQKDVTGLSEAISILGSEAEILLTFLEKASLEPTLYSEIERQLFDAPAHQAIAIPKLCRILGITTAKTQNFFPVETRNFASLPLPNVHSVDPSQNWVKNRLIQLPEETGEGLEQTWANSSILSGNWRDYLPIGKESDSEELKTLYWVLARPWCFFLAQIVFTQEAWAAERISGGIILELPETLGDRYLKPSRVNIVVLSPDGAELLCGSLGELILRCFAELGVGILSNEGVGLLDIRLAGVIEQLILRKVWQYSSDSGGKIHYTIHPSFSDSCYRAKGSKYFNRLASRVTVSIRNVAQQWGVEKGVGNREKTICSSFMELNLRHEIH